MRRYRRSRTISPSIPTGSTRSRNGNRAERPPLGPVRDRRPETRGDPAGGDDRLYRRFRADADRYSGIAAAIALGARTAARARRGGGGITASTFVSARSPRNSVPPDTRREKSRSRRRFAPTPRSNSSAACPALPRKPRRAPVDRLASPDRPRLVAARSRGAPVEAMPESMIFP